MADIFISCSFRHRDLTARLAAAHSARFEPNLVTSLSNLGAQLSALGQCAEADIAGPDPDESEGTTS